jgi:diacylglycerol kinase family enzyme
MDILALRSWVSDLIILCQGRCTCVIFAGGLMAFNADNTNNLMRGIEGFFAFTTCEAGYSNLILGWD